MRLTILSTSKNSEVTDGIREKVESKLRKIEKFLPADCEVKVLIRVVKKDQIVEITIPNFHGKTVRVEERADSLYTAIDMADAALNRTLRKAKDRYISTKREFFDNSEPICDESDEADDLENISEKIERRKKLSPRCFFTDEEAILQMEMLGHDFFVYQNPHGNVFICYKRRHGGYGILEATT